MGMGNGNSPHGNPMGMGISQKKLGMGMGWNGNVESHSCTSLVVTNSLELSARCNTSSLEMLSVQFTLSILNLKPNVIYERGPHHIHNCCCTCRIFNSNPNISKRMTYSGQSSQSTRNNVMLSLQSSLL